MNFMKMIKANMIGKTIVACSLLLSTYIVNASILDAKSALNNGQFKIAYDEFFKYAKRGDHQAQYYIGTMYLNGNGVPVDIYQANAWFNLALSYGSPDAKGMISKIRRDLPSKRQAKAIASELNSLYGKEALQVNLYPNISANNQLDRQLTPIQIVNPEITDESGWALVSVDVDENGRVNNPRMFASFPANVFDNHVLDAAQQWQFMSQQSGNEIVQVNDYLIKFQFRASKPSKHQLFLQNQQKYKANLLDKANQGNAEAQYLVSRLYGQGIFRPNMNENINTAAYWMLEAAKKEHSAAQYEIALRLIEGRSVELDQVKAFKWLQMSANNSYAPAQAIYAKEILLTNPPIIKYKKAIAMLQSAANQGNENAKQQLGLIYSTSLYQEFLTPNKSIAIANAGLMTDSNHPDYLMLLAAANFSDEDNRETAKSLLQQAYDSAIDRGWPTDKLLTLAQFSGSNLDLKVASQDQITYVEEYNKISRDGDIATAKNAQYKLVPIDRVGPVYPPEAEDLGVEGWVTLSYSVNRNGFVENIEVLKSQPSKIFNQAAIDALKQWRFEPIIENGMVIKRDGVKIKLAFSLKDKKKKI
jgi:TonB family protein